MSGYAETFADLPPDDESSPTAAPACDCDTRTAYHPPYCPLRATKSEAEWEQIADKVRAATGPKSRRRGRITDHDSARKEIEGMAQTAKDDPRFTPCMAFVYGHLGNRGFKNGSVIVMAGAEWLSRWSEGRFSEKQCRTALDRLELLGYIEPKSWSWVKKHDRGLFEYAKRRYGGAGGRWARAYLLKQDLPERDVVPDEENPILEIMGVLA